MGNGMPAGRKNYQEKRSPKWSLWQRFIIPCKNGEDYLARLRIVDTPWFGVYLHDIFESDEQDPHNHPWSFISIVLRGRYKEFVFPDPSHSLSMQDVECKQHKRFSVHRMGAEAAHRITYASPRLKTLIIRGKRRSKGWGFFTAQGFVQWFEYGKDGAKVQ